MRAVILIISFCLILSANVGEQETTSRALQSATTIQPATSSTPQAATSLVPVPEPSEKALSYYRSGNVLWVANIIWGLLIPALFLFTGFSGHIHNWAQRLGKNWFFVIGIYFVIFSIISFVIDLPLDYYEGYVREHAYRLSNQNFGKWFGDALKGLLVGLVVGVLFLWVPYLLLRKSPRRWWLYTGLLTIPFLFLVILIRPIWIDPLFNKFGPMKDKTLEATILRLAERAGVEGVRVFEVDTSEDTKALYAYVTGFGNTTRIVLWDTTIAKMNEQELLSVMSHEMGHYVLGHYQKSILFFSVLIIATLYAVHRTTGWLIHRYKHRFGFDKLADIASLPLIILLCRLYLFIVTPIDLAYSRYIEHEADRFGLELTKNNHAAATAYAKLQTENLGVPRPGLLYKLWRAQHPTLGEHIDFCNTYRPWEKNEPLVYGRLFREAK
jgi:Zn-dependent protease with chaperone function